MFTSTYQAPFGPLQLFGGDAGLFAILWPQERVGRVRFTDHVDTGTHPVLDRTAAQLTDYFAGKRTVFDLPLDLRGTTFQVKAWCALATIPFGQTVSYGQQADRIGHPTAVRAIGAANGRNPISLILPCHRVVASNGALTGFAGGLDIKRWLLDFEADRDRQIS